MNICCDASIVKVYDQLYELSPNNSRAKRDLPRTPMRNDSVTCCNKQIIDLMDVSITKSLER
jgi:hypothetical protein